MPVSKAYLKHWTEQPALPQLHELIAGSVPWDRAEQDAFAHADMLLPAVQDASWAAEILPGQGEHECPILEVGCGIGRIMRVFMSRGYIVGGLDISRPMLAEAQKYLADFTGADCDVRRLKGLYLDNPEAPLACLPDASFGFVYSMLVFQHLPSMSMVNNVIRGIYRVLRPGGIARVQTLVGVPKTDGSPFHPWIGSLFANEHAFADAFSGAGFNIVESNRGLGYKDWLWVTARKPR